MLYLMALQELTKCPFRVVDEINQVLLTALSTKYDLPLFAKTLSVNSDKAEGTTECRREIKPTVSRGAIQ